MKGKLILCLDFDGVIHSYTSPWEKADIIPDPVVDGFYEWLEEVTKKFQIHVFSSRSSQFGGRNAMVTYIRDNAPEGYSKEILNQIFYPLTKPAAFLTIDDRGMRFTGTWPDVDKLLSFKPWNRE